MGETAVKAAQTTEKAAKADHTDKAKKAKKENKPSFFKGLKKEYKKIVFADRRYEADHCGCDRIRLPGGADCRPRPGD